MKKLLEDTKKLQSFIGQLKHNMDLVIEELEKLNYRLIKKMENSDKPSKQYILNRMLPEALKHPHFIDKDGDRHNYDCIGIACGLAKAIAVEYGKKLHSNIDYKGENHTFEKILPSFPPVVNAPYNNFGMWNMLNFGDPIEVDDIESGDWIIWQKKEAPHHGHIVTMYEFDNPNTELKVISGTTGRTEPRKARVDKYSKFKQMDEKYYSIYQNHGKIVRPRMI